MSSNQSSVLSPWLALLLLSVLVRLAYGKFILADHWPGDASWYLEAAQSLHDSGWIDPYWPPGLPHLLAGGMCLGISTKWLGMTLSLGMWVLFFWILRTVVFERQTNSRGWWLKAIFLVFPAFIYQSVVPLTYMPVTILLLMCWQWIGGTWGNVPWKEQLGLGLSMGLMALFRGASVALWPILLAGYFWSRQSWKGLILPAAVAVLVLGLWEARLYQQENRLIWINTANSYNFYLGNNPWTPEYKTWLLGSHDFQDHPEYEELYAEIDSVRALSDGTQELAFRRLAWQHIREEPGEFLIRATSRLMTFLSFDTLAGATMYRQSKVWGMVMLALDALCYMTLLVMAWYGWGSGKWLHRERLMWLAVCAAYTMPYVLAFAHPTYHLPLLPMFAWAAFRAKEFSWESLRIRHWSAWLLLGSLVVIQGIWIWKMAVGEG